MAFCAGHCCLLLRGKNFYSQGIAACEIESFPLPGCFKKIDLGLIQVKLRSYSIDARKVLLEQDFCFTKRKQTLPLLPRDAQRGNLREWDQWKSSRGK